MPFPTVKNGSWQPPKYRNPSRPGPAQLSFGLFGVCVFNRDNFFHINGLGADDKALVSLLSQVFVRSLHAGFSNFAFADLGFASRKVLLWKDCTANGCKNRTN